MMLLSFFAAIFSTICGFVIDEETNAPIQGATVYKLHSNNFVVTDSLGKFCFEQSDSLAEFEINHIGYGTIKFQFKDLAKNIPIRLLSNSRTMEEVVIKGIRAERTMPIPESTLEEKDLSRNYAGQEAPAILAQTPSITWYSDAGSFTGYSYMRMRGIDQTRINFTLNGVPLNEPEDQGVYFSNYPDFLNSIRSVQVQRGVGTSTNGTASYAGSVNFESVSLLDSSKVEVSTSYGSYNTYRISPEYSSGLINKKFSFYGRYSFTGSDGFRYHSGTKGQSFFFSSGYFGKKSVLKLTGFTGVSKNQMSYLAASETDLKSNYRTNYLSKDENDQFNQSLWMLQYTLNLNKKSYFTASVYYNRLKGGYGIYFNPDLYNFSVSSNFLGAIAGYQYRLGHFKFNSGLHLNKYERHHYMQIQPDSKTNLYDNTGEKMEVSSFVKIAYDIRKFTFFADVQFRHVSFTYLPDINSPHEFSPKDWNFVNPKAGISYLLGQKLIAYASLGKTTREPTRNDMFAGYDNIDSSNYEEVGNFSRVKPENVIDVEVGTKFTFSKIQFDVNLYLMKFKNEIAAIGQLSYIGLPLRKNVPSSYRRGIGISLIAQPTNTLKLLSNLNLSDNRIKSYSTEYDSAIYRNVQPLLSPWVLMNSSIQYKLLSWISLDLTARYQSHSFLDNTGNKNYMVPSSLILNTALSLRFLKMASLNFIVNNITNKKYFTSGYVQNSESYFFPMATRNYFLTLKIEI